MLLPLSAHAHAGDPGRSRLWSGATPPDVVVSCAPNRALHALITTIADRTVPDRQAVEPARCETHGQWRQVRPVEPWTVLTPMIDGAVFWSAASPDGSVEVHVCLGADRDGVSGRSRRDTAGRFWTLTPGGVR